MRKRWTSRAISVMRGINRRVRGNKEEAKGVAKSAVYHVASAMEATFPGRRRAGQTPPHHGKVASFSRVPSPASGNSGHDRKQDCPNSTEILGTGAMTPPWDTCPMTSATGCAKRGGTQAVPRRRPPSGGELLAG